MTVNKLKEQSLKRASQAWRLEKQYEPLIEEEYKNLNNQLQAILSELYAKYEVDGQIPYNRLRVRLTPSELELYKHRVNTIIEQNRSKVDEDTLLELDRILKHNNLSVIDSHTNTLEAHSLITIHNVSELVSESLLETHEYIECRTNYDIQKEAKTGWKINKKAVGAVLAVIALDDDWGGMTYNESLKASRHRLLRDVKRNILMGVKGNQTFTRLSITLKEQVMGGKGSNLATNTLRDKTTATISKTSLDVYSEAGLEKYQFVATLDDRTTSICQSLDGQVFNLEDAEEGVNLPMMHFSCRSTTTPYFEGDDLSEIVRRARDMDSQQNYTIPGDITYEEWEKNYNQ